MPPLEYTEISHEKIGRGYNINGAAIPAKRVVAKATNAASPDAIDLLVAGNVAKMYGVTQKQIDPNTVGDIHLEGVVPVESDGSGAIAAGQLLTANTTAGATQGRVLVAAPGAGANAHICGQAETDAPATAGAVVMMRILRSVMQG